MELPVAGEHAETLLRLPAHRRDPSDRRLIAQAITEPMHLLTADTQLAPYTELVLLA